MNRILIVDDEPSICWALTELLQEEGTGHQGDDLALAGQAVAAVVPELGGLFGGEDLEQVAAG